MKRIAIATSDGVSVCDHLARAAAFVIVDVNEGRETARSLRTRGTGACGNHATFVEMLADCEAVICGGIGEGAAVSLAAHGIAALVSPLSVGTPIESALAEWIDGRLVTSGVRVCLCSH
jgi:predicted Fe-Mo cluster-binding NifX family protein